MDNSVIHFELPADDHDRAKKFYAEAFGWDETTMEGPAGMYTIVRTGPVDDKRMPTVSGYINGGIGPREGNLMHPTIMINVKSLEEAAEKIEAAGGKILGGKVIVPNMGQYQYFNDSEGSIIGIWETLSGSM